MRRNFTRLSFAAGVAIFRRMCYAVPIEYVRRLHMDPIFEIELEDCPVCRGAGVMQGANGKLLPTAEATRAQTAAMLHRFCEDVLK